ncbi:MAG: MlaD family protein [Solirubrobacteraceae bacterium]
MLVGVYVFGGRAALDRGPELRAIVTSSNQLKPGSPVRIAGLDVGRVRSVGRGPRQTSVVVLELTDEATVVRRDATISIRPRMFFEGGFVVDLRPGTPGARPAGPGFTIPLDRTARPVQLDQVLSTFTADLRTAITRTVDELAIALDGPSGRNGVDGLAGTVRELDRALGDITTVARALQGRPDGDLGAALRGTANVAGQLAADRPALGRLVRSAGRVTVALAREDASLRRSLRELDEFVRAAPESLDRIDATLPAVDALARPATRALDAIPPALRPSARLLNQIQGLARASELPALIRAAAPVLGEVPELVRSARIALPLADQAARCVRDTVIPAMSRVVPDGVHTTGRPAWLEFLHASGGAVAIASSFDGNGTNIRFGLTLSDHILTGALPGFGTSAALLPDAVVGTNPHTANFRDVVFRPDKWCSEQPLTPLTHRADGAPPLGQWQAAPAARATSGTGATRTTLRRLLASPDDRKDRP